MDNIDEILASINNEDDLFDDLDKDNEAGADEINKEDDLPMADGTDPEELIVDADLPVPDIDHPPLKQDDAPVTRSTTPFTLKGTKTWNTREPYILRLDEGQLALDTEEMEKSFLYFDAPADAETVKSMLKKEIVNYIRRPDQNIILPYSDYIYKLIILIIEEITTNFNCADDKTENLFIYHIGPLTLYSIIIHKMKSEKVGYCYKFIPKNKAARFFPDEFIKEKILIWFEENINTRDIPADSVQHFEEIKNIVTLRYKSQLKLFNSRLNAINSKLGPNKRISRDRLFRMKGVEWFGVVNIEIFRRFIERGVFV